ncbi:Peroxisome biogenesis protein 22 [Linum perenne]
MAESSKEELLQLIKKFGAYLSVKMSSFLPISLRNLDTRSAGAIAGLALAVVFTWRLLRSPSANTRRQPPKRNNPSTSISSASTQTNAASIASGACSSSEDLRAQNVVDEFFQPVKPTLGQIVRQKLSEGRKVTCCLLGVILEECTPEELQKQATVRSSVLEVLLEITKFCDLYLMERVLDDETEQRVLTALESAGVFTSGGLVKDKVLFCSTETGRTSFVRQLEPDWHIDSSPEIVTQLAVNFLQLPSEVYQVSTPHLSNEARTVTWKRLPLTVTGALLRISMMQFNRADIVTNLALLFYLKFRFSHV